LDISHPGCCQCRWVIFELEYFSLVAAAHMQNAEFCRKLQSFPVCICRDCLVHRSVSSSGFLLRLTINLCSSFAWVVGLDTSLLSENGSACRRSGVVPMFG